MGTLAGLTAATRRRLGLSADGESGTHEAARPHPKYASDSITSRTPLLFKTEQKAGSASALKNAGPSEARI